MSGGEWTYIHGVRGVFSDVHGPANAVDDIFLSGRKDSEEESVGGRMGVRSECSAEVAEKAYSTSAKLSRIRSYMYGSLTQNILLLYA